MRSLCLIGLLRLRRRRVRIRLRVCERCSGDDEVDGFMTCIFAFPFLFGGFLVGYSCWGEYGSCYITMHGDQKEILDLEAYVQMYAYIFNL